MTFLQNLYRYSIKIIVIRILLLGRNSHSRI